MTEVLTPDLCVIGAGSAGLSVAAVASALGASVVLIERDRMGGDCLNVGCVPSKALIAAAHRAEAVRGAAAFGIRAAPPEVDFRAVRAHLRGVIEAIAPNDSVERFRALGARVLAAEARFESGRRVVADGVAVEARRFVIATGSRPAIPSIPGLGDVPYLTNETVFDLDRAPDHLVVIGGGSAGVELAQAYRRLGVPVTLIEAARLLPRDDPEMAAVVERALEQDGVDVLTGAAIEGVAREDGRIRVALAGGPEVPARMIAASHVLVATGRRPSLDRLGLDRAGIAHDGSGILVDRGLKTTNPRIYAIGDCAAGGAGPYRFTHVANYHAGLVVRNALFRLPVRVDLRAVPRVTYTDPEIAAVGLSEAEARASRKEVRVLRWPVSENDRAQAERTTHGHVKAVVDGRGRVLGCAIAAPHAGDLIVPWAMAVPKGLKVQDLAGLVFPYPTLSEVSKRAAVEHLRAQIDNPWLKRLMRAARWLG